MGRLTCDSRSTSKFQLSDFRGLARGPHCRVAEPERAWFPVFGARRMFTSALQLAHLDEAPPAGKVVEVVGEQGPNLV